MPGPLIPEGVGLSPLSELTVSLGTAIGVPAPIEQNAPISISVPALGIDRAPITPVGVTQSGEMEIPGAQEVGWYKYGAVPGDPGASVLAAHVAFNGRDGVFRYLTELDPGQQFSVVYADGSDRVFTVASRRQYDKQALPFDKIFAKDGLPSLTLITCGGQFNRSLNSYDDNIVVYAV